MALASRKRRRFLQVVGATGIGTLASSGAAAADAGGKPSKGGGRILIENGTIVSMDPKIGDLDGGDLLIEDGRILDVGDGLDRTGASVIDASDALVVPGFVNTHAHLWQTPVRGVAGDLSLSEYFADVHTLRPHYTPDDIHLAGLTGALEQLHAGTTTVLDFNHALATFGHAQRGVDGLLESGIRAVFAHGPPIDPEWWDDSELEHPADDVRRLHDRLADEPLVDLGLAIRGPDFSTDAVTEHDIELAREYDAMAAMHIGVSTYEGPDDHGLPALADRGLLGPDLNFVHANAFDDDLYELVADEGISVSVTPEVEMQMGHGLPATGDVLEPGGRAVLGTDIVSGNSGDMFTQTRVALQFERGMRNAARLERGEIPDSLEFTTRDALRLATIEGAKALGLGDEIGSLTPGKRADVVLLDERTPNLAPVHDPVQSVVLQAGPENVDTVLVDGRVVKSDGELVYPELERRYDQLERVGSRILEQAGFNPRQ